MNTINLNGTWQLTGTNEAGQPLQCIGHVPGCIHTDLSGDDFSGYFYRDNAVQQRWIEDHDFTYTKSFTLDSMPNSAMLCFEGLDTYCDVILNGTLLGHCDDMFIPWCFDALASLKTGDNTLEVHFFSPVRRVQDKESLPGAFTCERLHTRRIQCTYGWDWVDRFVTMGIWRPVALICDGILRVNSATVDTVLVDEFSAQVNIRAETADYEKGGILEAELFSPTGDCIWQQKKYCAEPEISMFADISSPQLWQPNGLGNQPLYTLVLRAPGGELRQQFGIRTVKLLQLSDAPGTPAYQECQRLRATGSGQEYDKNEAFSSFCVIVNGHRVMCKGANWVPSEAFPSAERPEKITRILELAAKAGVNMIRVWGGGIFECQHFYDECDRLGIMVTQDFLMACGHYPENEDDFLSKLKLEALTAVRALRYHPCLVWWTGDNENAINGCDTDENYPGRRSAYHAIAPVLQQWDPRRRFLPSSPYGGDHYASKTVGTTHNTQFLSYTFDYIDEQDMTDYKEYLMQYLARFIAEDPTAGAICLPSLRRFMTQEDIFGEDTRMWYSHTQSNPALKHELFDYTVTAAQKVLGAFSDAQDRFFKLKYIQYEWIRVTLEQFRRNKWFCSGIVYWMLADCWPAASGWALIDYYCLPKASYYAFSRSAAGIIGSLAHDTDSADCTLSLCNDTLEDVTVTATVYELSLADGNVRRLARNTYTSLANSVTVVQRFALPDDGHALICELEYAGGRDRCFYKNGALSVHKAAEIKADFADGCITVSATRYLHTVELEGDAVFEDNYFSLLPGETRTIHYQRNTAADDDITVCGYTL